MTHRKMAEIIRNQQPCMLPADTSLSDACKKMHRHRIGAILVVDGNDNLLGIFTGRDLVRVIADGGQLSSTRLKAAMTRPCGRI